MHVCIRDFGLILNSLSTYFIVGVVVAFAPTADNEKVTPKSRPKARAGVIKPFSSVIYKVTAFDSFRHFYISIIFACKAAPSSTWVSSCLACYFLCEVGRLHHATFG